MRATLAIQRFNPQIDAVAHVESYDVELPAGSTVLEALMKIQDERDGTLTFRRACRHAICGSCGVRVNGCAKLACNTQLADAAREAQEMAARRAGASRRGTKDGGSSADTGEASAAIAVAPLGNMPLVKDLVTDMGEFWRKLRLVRPWLMSFQEQPDPERERLQAPQEWHRVAEGVLCLACGACYSDCNALEASPEFIGPTALVMAHRYAVDSRDDYTHRRAFDLSGEHGLWECTRCYFCTERCPKHIRVRELIAQLGGIAFDEGLRTDPGARHAQAFVASLEESGRLNEARLPVRSKGLAWTARRLPKAVRLALAGKLVSPRPQRIDGHDDLRDLMRVAREKP